MEGTQPRRSGSEQGSLLWDMLSLALQKGTSEDLQQVTTCSGSAAALWYR